MSPYSIALFLHIVGALLLFVLLTVEGYGLRIGKPSARFNQVVGPVSALLILIPGLYMVASTWGWKGWIVVGVSGWFLIAAAGAATGIALLRGRLSLSSATLSWATRVGMAVGIVFVMSVKPGSLIAVLAVVVGAVAGGLAGVALPRQVRPA